MRLLTLLVLIACGGKSQPEPRTMAAISPPSAVSAAPKDLRSAPAKVSTRLLATDVAYTNFGFTPDGKRIVYASTKDGLVVVDPSGANKRQLAPQANNFQVSPDGKTVVYGTDTLDIYAVAIDGGKPARLTAKPFHVEYYKIMPDNKAVGIAQADGPVWLVPIGGGMAKKLLDKHTLGTSYDFAEGDRVVYDGDPHVMIRDLTGGAPRSLTPSVVKSGLLQVIDGAALVTADDNVLVAPFEGEPVRIEPKVSWPPRRVADGKGFTFHDEQWNVYYADAKALRPRKLNRPLRDGEQVWGEYSTTNSAVIYEVIDMQNAHYELRVAAFDGSFDRALATVAPAKQVLPRPTRDGRTVVVHVVMTSSENHMTDSIEVYAVALDGGSVVRVSPLNWTHWTGFEVGARHALVGVKSDLHIVDLP